MSLIEVCTEWPLVIIGWIVDDCLYCFYTAPAQSTALILAVTAYDKLGPLLQLLFVCDVTQLHRKHNLFSQTIKDNKMLTNEEFDSLSLS